jgi:hypothetical protein
MIMTDDLQRERAQRQKDAQRLIAWLIIVVAYCGSFVGLAIYLTGWMTCPREPRAALNAEPVVSEGSITLGDVADHTMVLAVACSRCARAGRYNLDTLIARHGEGFSIPKLLRLLSKDCVKRASVSAYDLCGVHCPELPGFFLGEKDWPRWLQPNQDDPLVRP